MLTDLVCVFKSSGTVGPWLGLLCIPHQQHTQRTCTNARKRAHNPPEIRITGSGVKLYLSKLLMLPWRDMWPEQWGGGGGRCDLCAHVCVSICLCVCPLRGVVVVLSWWNHKVDCSIHVLHTKYLNWDTKLLYYTEVIRRMYEMIKSYATRTLAAFSGKMLAQLNTEKSRASHLML